MGVDDICTCQYRPRTGSIKPSLKIFDFDILDVLYGILYSQFSVLISKSIKLKSPVQDEHVKISTFGESLPYRRTDVLRKWTQKKITKYNHRINSE
jgi:hypothetical protein